MDIDKDKIKNILVVEDDLGDQKLIQITIRKLKPDCSLTLIADGEEAQNFINDPAKMKPIQMVILDLNIPKVSGFDLLYQLHKNNMLERIYTVIFSTSSYESNINREELKLADKFYTKPSSLQKFIHIFKEMFSIKE